MTLFYWQVRTDYLSLMQLIIANSNYIEHSHRKDDLVIALNQIEFSEEATTNQSEMDVRIVQEIRKLLQGSIGCVVAYTCTLYIQAREIYILCCHLLVWSCFLLRLIIDDRLQCRFTHISCIKPLPVKFTALIFKQCAILSSNLWCLLPICSVDISAIHIIVHCTLKIQYMCCYGIGLILITIY